MAATREIAIGGLVELTERVDDAPAGAQGGIADMLDGGKVIVELTQLPAEPILDRIVVVPVERLRVLQRPVTARPLRRRRPRAADGTSTGAPSATWILSGVAGVQGTIAQQTQPAARLKGRAGA